ncbi:hypothetical protein [Desulfovibrio litoralis]|uniref:hypothetical protein n=1 Tax=Desulfovibrio litoralis TaxID=466107 RepID=UPI0011605239|nr:hypothetical protein [Desulfovibrio litoralis]
MSPFTINCFESCIGAFAKDGKIWQLRLETESQVSFEFLSDPEFRPVLSKFLQDFIDANEPVDFEIKLLASSELLSGEIKTLFEKHPDVKTLQDSFGAYFVDWGNLKNRR